VIDVRKDASIQYREESSGTYRSKEKAASLVSEITQRSQDTRLVMSFAMSRSVQRRRCVDTHPVFVRTSTTECRSLEHEEAGVDPTMADLTAACPDLQALQAWQPSLRVMHVVAAVECTLVLLCTASLAAIRQMLPLAISSTGMVVLFRQTSCD